MKICIAHFRVGLTDGVSLQIDERVRILKRLGQEVYLIASSGSPLGGLKIPFLDYKQHPKIKKIQKSAFRAELSEEQLALTKKKIEKIATEIEKSLNDFWEDKQFTLIFIHNIFSLPVCLPATIAFYNFLKNHPQITAIAVHHDFYWDPPRI